MRNFVFIVPFVAISRMASRKARQVREDFEEKNMDEQDAQDLDIP